jgi:hypothetical protein
MPTNELVISAGTEVTDSEGSKQGVGERMIPWRFFSFLVLVLPSPDWVTLGCSQNLEKKLPVCILGDGHAHVQKYNGGVKLHTKWEVDKALLAIMEVHES